MARAAVPAAGITEKLVLSNSEFIVRRSQVSWYNRGSCPPPPPLFGGSSSRRSQSLGTGAAAGKPPGPAQKQSIAQWKGGWCGSIPAIKSTIKQNKILRYVRKHQVLKISVAEPELEPEPVEPKLF